jgi:hypothetical protein
MNSVLECKSELRVEAQRHLKVSLRCYCCTIFIEGLYVLCGDKPTVLRQCFNIIYLFSNRVC